MGKIMKHDKNGKTSSSKRKNKSRKELRKEKRLAKKEKKNQHYQRKFLNLKNEIHHDVMNNNKKTGKISDSLEKNKLKTTKAIGQGQNNNKVYASESVPSSFEKQSLHHKKEIKEHKKLKKEMDKQRNKQLLIENKNEDKVIKKLEKQLRLNKRKSKTLPQSFMDEGLDYLLDVCDSEKINNALNAEKNYHDSGSEFEEDIAVITGKAKKKEERKRNNAENINDQISEDDSDEFTDNVSNFDDSENEGDFGDQSEDDELSDENNGEESDDTVSEDEKPPLKKVKVSEKNSKINNCSDNSDSEESGFTGDSMEGEEVDADNFSDDVGVEEEISVNDKKNENKSVAFEDIYGRKRDKLGNVIAETGKYIPPHLKAQLMGSNGREEQLARLKKQIKGLLNRLADNNMHNIVSQMDQLFMQNSRNDMNDTLTKLTFESLIQPVLVPDRLVIEHTMLIAALHANVGTEVGAHFLQAVVEKFSYMYRANIDVANKEIDNILVVISQLYSFKVFNCVLMFDILNRLTEVSEFGEKEVELLLTILRNVGFNLRKDDPVGLKNIILKVQSVVNNSSDLSKQSRVRFMLDVLTAIKNNNMTKIPNYDPSQIEHHKKVLKNLIQKGKYISELNITLEDLLKAPERGRWWVVGSAWSGGDVTKASNTSGSDNVITDISQNYLDLAKKQRMSTDTRRNIFCIIMSAEDYMDAFEKLLRLGLKGPQEQTIIHVLVHCVIQEKTFNPYYAFLASQFCTTDRKYLITLQYHLWDRIRELSDLKGFQITNLALFLTHLILEKALPLSVLKVIEFASLSKPYVRLLRRIFLTMLLHNSDETVAEVFQRISHPPKLKLFRESIRLFFHHFILRNISEDSVQMVKLKERVKLAENCMSFR